MGDLPSGADLEAEGDAPQTVDLASGEDGAVDGGGNDAGMDAAFDLSSHDQGKGDAPHGDIWGTVTRSVMPVFDGKGDIYIGIAPAFFFPPEVIKAADLSQPQSSVTYTFYNVAPGDYELWAFLDDNGNANAILPGSDFGDLVMSSVIPFTFDGTPQQIDFVLNQVMGFISDGGVGEGGASQGSLRGKISRSIVPALDGKGPIYVSLHSQLPPQGQVAATSLYGDLSSSYDSEMYFLGMLEPGNYYLRVFLDDNENAFFMAPEIDPDDLTTSRPIQVHVVGGVLNEQDLVLDEVHQ